MTSFAVLLTSVADIKAFVNLSSQMSCEVDVISGRYVVDAKSIMGLFSVNLSQPITVQVQGTEAETEQLKASLGDFVVAV